MTESWGTARRVEPNPLAGAYCRYCGGHDLWVEFRLRSKPLGTFSLSGSQHKTTATWHPYGVCGDCGHVSEGKPA